MQFWQPGQFLEENQKVMFNLRRWQNRKKQKWYFLRKSSFPQNVSGEEDCSFQKPNKKISTKRTVVLAQNPKMQNVKKRNIKFFRSLFSTKSSDGQVETSTDYPAGKFRPKARNLWLSLLHWWKNSKFFQFLFLSNVHVDTWKWSIDYPAKSYMTKAEFLFGQLSESHKKSCMFLETNFKRVLWTGRMKFGHNRGRQTCQKAVFCPMS